MSSHAIKYNPPLPVAALTVAALTVASPTARRKAGRISSPSMLLCAAVSVCSGWRVGGRGAVCCTLAVMACYR